MGTDAAVKRHQESDSAPAHQPSLWRTDAALVVGVTVVSALSVLAFNKRFYYADDTQNGSIGIWYRFGARLLEGELSFLDLSTWGSGNILVEGQWGVYNPIMLAIAVGSQFVNNFALYATVLKVIALSAGALGVLGLLRELRAGRWLAVFVASLVPLTGFTVYMDATSWVTGLICWSIFPWLWLAILRLRSGDWGFVPTAGFLFLIVSVGYFHGTIVALFLVASYAAAAALQRRWRSALDFLVVALFGVLVMVTTYAPSILSSAVTLRSGTSIQSTGLLGPDLSDLASMTAIAGGVEFPTWSLRVISVPLFYIAWAVPLLLLGIVDRVRSTAFDWTPIGLLVLSGAVLLGPTDAGPLRFPVRVLPYVVLAAVVLIVQISEDRQWSILRTRALPALLTSLFALPLFGFWITFSDSPEGVLAQLFGLAAVMAALALLAGIARWGARPGALVAVALSATVLLTVLTRYITPAPFFTDFGTPAARERLQTQLATARGPVFVVGNTEGAPLPQLWEEALVARLWQVNPAAVQNSYVVIGYANYVNDLGLNYLGMTPPQTLDTLFSEDAATGAGVVDLLGIDNVQIWRHSFPDRDLADPPDGWRVAEEGQYTVLWSREEPRFLTGSVTYAGPGISYDVLTNVEDQVVVRVTNSSLIPQPMVFARLAWPGYRVSGATLADPVRGYLLTVEVPAGATDEEVVITYTAPGFFVGIATGGAAIVLIGVAETLRRRRRAEVARGSR